MSLCHGGRNHFNGRVRGYAVKIKPHGDFCFCVKLFAKPVPSRFQDIVQVRFIISKVIVRVDYRKNTWLILSSLSALAFLGSCREEIKMLIRIKIVLLVKKL